MGEIRLRTCDILGRRETEKKPIRKVRIRIEVQQGDETWKEEWSPLPKDMCPGALERAKGFVTRAVNPPTERKATG